MSNPNKTITKLQPSETAVSPITPAEALSFRQAFVATTEERLAIPELNVLDTNVELRTAIHIVRQSVPRINLLMPEIAQLPVPLKLIQAIDLRARAAIHAHVLYTASIAPPGRLQAVYEEVIRRRQRIRSDITNLMNHGIIPANSLDGMSMDTGYRNVAYAGLYGVATLRSHAQAVTGRALTTATELDELELLSNELEDLFTRREHSKGADPEIADQRDRSFTLVHESYEWARCAVHFVRWFHGDAREIAPNLFSNSNKSNKAGKGGTDEPTTEPDAPVSEPKTPPNPPTEATNPNSNPQPGVRGSNPFGQ